MSTSSWYNQLASKHGHVSAFKHIARFHWTLRRDRYVNARLPHRLECPCCGWTGNRFRDYVFGRTVMPGIECPRCDSHSRHRALSIWLRDTYKIQDRSGTALLFAPERCLEPCWRPAARLQRVHLDILAQPGVTLVSDIRKLPFESDRFDLIWCHHVLEQLPEDAPGIAELFRVLKPGTGELVISVNMDLNRATIEHGRRNSDQFDEWRLYGADFPERLKQAGFEIEPIVLELDVEEQKRYGVSTEPIFIARKPAS